MHLQYLPTLPAGRIATNIMVILLRALPNLFGSESIAEQHQRAIQNVGQYCDNMNDRWFATTVTRVYHDVEGATYTQESQGIVYYSKSLLYINAQQTLTSPRTFRKPREHFELISTDAWTIAIDHNPIGRNGSELKIAEGRTPASIQIANVIRGGNDITSRFESRIQRIVAHEYAEPSLDEQGRLVVRVDRNSYVNDPNTDRMRAYPILELVHSGQSGVQPSFLRSLKEEESGSLTETSQTRVWYTLNSDGNPIVQSIRYETSLPNEPKNTYDIRVRETSKPTWCEWPPRISISTGAVEVQRYGSNGNRTAKVNNLPVETAPLVQPYQDDELASMLQTQQATLQTTRDFVMAIPLSQPEPNLGTAIPPANIDEQPSKTVPLTIICLISCISAVWLVLWFRLRSQKL